MNYEKYYYISTVFLYLCRSPKVRFYKPILFIFIYAGDSEYFPSGIYIFLQLIEIQTVPKRSFAFSHFPYTLLLNILLKARISYIMIHNRAIVSEVWKYLISWRRVSRTEQNRIDSACSQYPTNSSSIFYAKIR